MSFIWITDKDMVYVHCSDQLDSKDDVPDGIIAVAEKLVKAKLRQAGIYDKVFVTSEIPVDDDALILAASFYTLCFMQESGIITWKSGEIASERIEGVEIEFVPTQLSRFILKGETQHKGWCMMADLVFNIFAETYGIDTKWASPQITKRTDEQTLDIELRGYFNEGTL